MRVVALMMPALLLGVSTGVFAAPGQGRGVVDSRNDHDTSHPFVLANDADFLAALIALYEESLDASLVAKSKARDKKIKAYATRVVSSHRSDLERLRRLFARHGKGGKPDFHYSSRMPDLRNLAGLAADRYYLSGLSQLTAEKIELAEFASGTVRSREIKRVAENVLETKSGELTLLTRWIKEFGIP